MFQLLYQNFIIPIPVTMQEQSGWNIDSPVNRQVILGSNALYCRVNTAKELLYLYLWFCNLFSTNQKATLSSSIFLM